MLFFRPDIWSLKTAYFYVEFSKGAPRRPLVSSSYVCTYIRRETLACNLMRKTSCIIPIQHVHTSAYHTYPCYPFTRHQDYWSSTCHMLVQQTSTRSRTAVAMLAVEYEYGNKPRRLQLSWSTRVTLGLRSLPALLTPNVAAAPPPSICSTVPLSSKTHEPNTASESPLYLSNGSFMLRVL